MKQTFTSSIKSIAAILPDSYNAGAQTSAAIDVSGYETVVVELLAGTQTTGTLDVKVQASATSGGTYADVTSATIPQVTSDNDEKVHRLEIDVRKLGAKPFVKVVATQATAAGKFGVMVALARPRVAPITPEGSDTVLA